MSRQKNVCLYSTKYPYNHRWCFSNQKVAEKDLLHLKFRFNLSMKFFLDIEKVYLYKIGQRIRFFLDEVNSLAKLKVLMIEEVIIEHRKLNSLSLEKLSLKCSLVNDIELCTPNLSSLIIWNYDSNNPYFVNFSYPLKVKHLQCLNFNSIFSGLKNLVTLFCKVITIDFRLNDYKSLTRLELFPTSENELQAARHIQEERDRLKRDALEMFFSGFKEELVMCESLFDSTCILDYEYLDRVVSNQSNFLGHIPWQFIVYISTLIKHASSTPRGFLDKFQLNQLFSTKDYEANITEQELTNLIELIRRSNTRLLHLYHLKLNLRTRQFYEEIASVQSISDLYIGPYLENVNFENFLKLKHLQYFAILSDKIEIEFVCKLFKELKLLARFAFYPISRKFKINIWIQQDGWSGRDRPFSCPYRLEYNENSSLDSYKLTVVRVCKDVNELIREIHQMKADPTLKDRFFD